MIEHDIAWLHVAVHDASGVHKIESLGEQSEEWAKFL